MKEKPQKPQLVRGAYWDPKLARYVTPGEPEYRAETYRFIMGEVTLTQEQYEQLLANHAPKKG